MSKITIEKIHALLETLAEYVMNDVAKKSEVNEIKTEVNEIKTEVNEIKTEVNEIKNDANDLKNIMNIIITGQDKIVKELDVIRTEQVTTNSALLRHEKRITALEEK